MATATYINTAQFSIDGDATGSLRIGTRLRLDQGDDGVLITEVAAALYSAGGDITTVTTKAALLTENLTDVKRGPIFVDDVAEESNLSGHSHKEEFQGGAQAFGEFDDYDEVAALKAFAAHGADPNDALIWATLFEG